MSQFAASEQQRPGMRRKSSAQNLLSSFKSPPNSTSVSPAPLLGGSSNSPQPLTVSVSSSAAYTGAAGAPTPTTATPKDWDAQSLHADSLSGGTTTAALSQGTSDEYLRDLVQKRILTLTYIRNIHEGYVLTS